MFSDKVSEKKQELYFCVVMESILIHRRTEGKQGDILTAPRLTSQIGAAKFRGDSVPLSTLLLPLLFSVAVASDVACISTPPDEGILTEEALAQTVCQVIVVDKASHVAGRRGLHEGEDDQGEVQD